MRISLIAMSGTGKSYWSAKLAEEGFTGFSCDELIAARLASELTRPDGTLMELGEWMGFPFDAHYREREARYLCLEVEVLTEILDLLEAGRVDSPNVVIDTTGSVIYTGQELLDRLRRLTTVVHLSIPPALRDRMLQAYLAAPRPVLWREHYAREPRETEAAALARSYARLLDSRLELYARLADVTIDYARRSAEGFCAASLVKAIAAQ